MKTFEAVTDRVCTEVYTKFFEKMKESEEMLIILVDLYDTSGRPVLTCGSGTWILTTEETKALGIFERNTVRRIYGLT
jgi:hypothetical protein